MDEQISVVLWILLRFYVVNKEVADFTFLTLTNSQVSYMIRIHEVRL